MLHKKTWRCPRGLLVDFYTEKPGGETSLSLNWANVMRLTQDCWASFRTVFFSGQLFADWLRCYQHRLSGIGYVADAASVGKSRRRLPVSTTERISPAWILEKNYPNTRIVSELKHLHAAAWKTRFKQASRGSAVPRRPARRGGTGCCGKTTLLRRRM